MKGSYSPDERLEPPWMVSYSYFDKILFSYIMKKVTLFKPFRMLFGKLLSFCFWLRLLIWKHFFILDLWNQWLFHPQAWFDMFKCYPFLQKNFLNHLFKVWTEFEIFVLWTDSFLEVLPELGNMLFINISIKWVKFLIFFEKGHITSEH